MRIRISEETINKIHLSKICFVYFFLHHKHKFELLKYRYLIPGVTIRTRNLIYIRMCWMYTNVNSIAMLSFTGVTAYILYFKILRFDDKHVLCPYTKVQRSIFALFAFCFNLIKIDPKHKVCLNDT